MELSGEVHEGGGGASERILYFAIDILAANFLNILIYSYKMDVKKIKNKKTKLSSQNSLFSSFLVPPVTSAEAKSSHIFIQT